MDLLDPREPINTWTHLAGALLSLMALARLLHASRGDVARRRTLAIYGLSLVFCYVASSLMHGLKLDPAALEPFERLDRFAIFVLIAGTYTPMAWVLLPGRWRTATLACVWGTTAIAGVGLALAGVFPLAWNTGLYLAMGWGSVICLVEIARNVPPRDLGWLVGGGVLYSVGAIINQVQWPALAAPEFGSHELFHVFVLAGSYAHYRFALDVVVPHRSTAERGPHFDVDAPLIVGTRHAARGSRWGVRRASR
jgi:hemolysin III